MSSPFTRHHLLAVVLGCAGAFAVPMELWVQGDSKEVPRDDVSRGDRTERLGRHAPTRAPRARPDGDVHPTIRRTRAAFRTLWGSPAEPLRLDDQPSEARVRQLLTELADADWSIQAVDCTYYPCTATMFARECPGASVGVAIVEQFPHAFVTSNEMGSRVDGRRVRGCKTTVAFLDRPVELSTPEWLYVYRLTNAIEHRAAQANLAILHEWAADESEPIAQVEP